MWLGLVALLGVCVQWAAPQTVVFHEEPTDAKVTVQVPFNFSKLLGKVEPAESEWFVLFEVDRGLIPSTFMGMSEEIQAGDRFPHCPAFHAVRPLTLSLELFQWFLRVKGANLERYEFPEPVPLGTRFAVDFHLQEEEDGPICALPVRTSAESSAPHHVSLAALARPTPTAPARRAENLRLATFKTRRPAAPPTAAPAKTYIDIKNDRAVYEQVQKSRTKEVNNAWSPTFLMFMWFEVAVIGAFVLFGLVMFVLLQIKPSHNDKFVPLSE